MLKDYKSYTNVQILSAKNFSPAIKNYLSLAEKKTTHFSDQIRIRRHKHWLNAAFATYFKTASPAEVCKDWSKQTIHILNNIMSEVGFSQDNLALFALGKLGAEELNLSSDIDILFVGDRNDDINFDKKLRQFRNLCSEFTAFGFCYRLDFDLRPGGRFGPLVSTPEQFEHYYWTLGEPWERLALIRFLSIWGDKEIISQTTEIAKKYCFRKFSDFTLLDTFKNLRQKIHRQNSLKQKKLFDLKLDIGGIRDIELFAHTLQVMYGGRSVELRTNKTDIGLELLEKAKLISSEVCAQLIKNYWQLRELENEIQVYRDEQTHLFDKDKLFSESKLADPIKISKFVDTTVSELLGAVDFDKNGLPLEIGDQKDWLKQLSFSNNVVNEVWPNLIDATALSKRSYIDENLRKQFLFNFINQLQSISIDNELAIKSLLDFVKSIRAKATFFSLFEVEPKIVRDLAYLFSCSPYLSGLLIARPEIIDSFFLRKTEDYLGDDLELLLEDIVDHRRLSELITANKFLIHKDILQVNESLSSAADYVTKKLLNHTTQEQKSSFSILALGKWGSQEMGFGSDLDFIFVCPNKVQHQDQKAAQRFITRLTERNKGGFIYQVDLRLRPSGTSGPLIVSEENLRSYLVEKAEIWERQSYLRCRPLWTSQKHLMHEAIQKKVTDEDIKKLLEIRHKLLKVETMANSIDIKYNPGGLIDMEFCVQMNFLINNILPNKGAMPDLIDQLSRLSSTWKTSGVNFLNYYLNFRKVEQILYLVTNSNQTQIEESSETLVKSQKLLGSEDINQFRQLKKDLIHSKELIKTLDPIFAGR